MNEMKCEGTKVILELIRLGRSHGLVMGYEIIGNRQRRILFSIGFFFSFVGELVHAQEWELVLL